MYKNTMDVKKIFLPINPILSRGMLGIIPSIPFSRLIYFTIICLTTLWPNQTVLSTYICQSEVNVPLVEGAFIEKLKVLVCPGSMLSLEERVSL